MLITNIVYANINLIQGHNELLYSYIRDVLKFANVFQLLLHTLLNISTFFVVKHTYRPLI